MGTGGSEGKYLRRRFQNGALAPTCSSASRKSARAVDGEFRKKKGNLRVDGEFVVRLVGLVRALALRAGEVLVESIERKGVAVVLLGVRIVPREPAFPLGNVLEKY